MNNSTENKKELICRPIGYISSPYEDVKSAPRCGAEAPPEQEAFMEIDSQFSEAMNGMTAGKQYMILFWFDRCGPVKQTVPYHRTGPMTGLFSTHAPARPNPIGVSVVTVTRIEGQKVFFTGVDMLNGTPVLDIKNA